VTLLAALTGAVAISFSAIFFALSEVDPITGASYRFAYALPVLALLWWIRRREDERTPAKRWLGFVAGIALGIDVILWHMAIEQIGTGLATLLANSQVIFVAIGGWVLLGEKPTRRIMFAIPVVLVGVAFVSGIGQAGAFGANPILGTAFALLAAVFYAAFLLGFRASNDIAAPAAGPLMEATAGALLVTLLLGLFGPGVDLTPGWPANGWLLALALGPQVAAWLLVGYALPRLPAVETSTIILLQPALTIIWGSVIFTERPSTLQWLGVALILLGVGSVAAARARGAPQPAASAA
jgi:drug/metabolite transporter (DMT)-like permease